MDELSVFLKGQPREVQMMAATFRALRWDVEVVQAFLATSARNGSTDVGGILGDDLAKELDEAEGMLQGVTSVNSRAGFFVPDLEKKSRGHVTLVRYKLDEWFKVYMRTVISAHSRVEFVDSRVAEYHPHAKIRAFKDAMDVWLLRMVLPDARVLEVGPNLAKVVRRCPQVGKYLGLVPLVDTLDLERDVTAKASLRIQIRNGHLKPAQRRAAEDACQGSGSRLFSRELLQNVKWPCDTILALDSLYGVHIDDAVLAMHRNGAKQLIGSLSNVGRQFQEYWYGQDVEGRIGQTEQIWKTDVKNNVIEFLFDRSSTRPYRHVLENFASWFKHPQRVFRVGDVSYVFRVLPCTNEVCYAFGIMRVESEVSEVDTLPTYVFRGNEREVLITTNAVNLRYPKGSPHRMEPVSMYVGAESFSRVFQERLVRGKGKLDDIIRFARTNRVNIVHNGVRVSCENPVSLDHLRWFCVAVDQLGDQMERTSIRDWEYVQRHMQSGGWVTQAQVQAAKPGVARTLWSQLVGSMSEVVPVTVSSGTFTSGMDNSVRILEGTKVKCVEIQEMRQVLGGKRGVLDAEERVACEAWLEYMTQQDPCKCVRCICGEEEEEKDGASCDDSVTVCSDDDSYFDASETGISASSVSVNITNIFGGPVIDEVGPDIVEKGLARDATEEYLVILEKQVDAKEAQARRNADRLLDAGGITLENLRVLDTDRVKHYGVRVSHMGLVVGVIGNTKVSDLAHVYDPVKRVFYNVEKDMDGRVWLPATASDVCYTDDDMMVWIYPELSHTANVVLRDPSFGRPPERLPFLNGIWGAGKTFLAKAWFREQQNEGLKVMFVGASRKPTETVRAELFGNSTEGNEAVRTFGSLLSRPPVGKQVDVLVLDEVCMQHAAEVYMVLWLLRPKKFWACGDYKQMHYVPFLAGFVPRYASLVGCSDLAMLNKGHRVCKDVYAGGLLVYGQDSGIHPCDCPEHQRASESLEIRKISSVAEVLLEKDALVLTHGQALKDEIKKMNATKGMQDSVGVFTMAEYQGGTVDKAIIVRKVVASKKGSIYHELDRTNVGVSRSTGSVVYHTCSTEQDAMVRFIQASKSLANREKIEENIRRFGSTPAMDVVTLKKFIDGVLPQDHPALVAGRALKRMLV